MKRAKKGGEYGANGEWYEGGKFINTVADNPKGRGKKTKKTGKREIEPYKWEIQPTTDHRSIYGQLAGIYGRVEDGVMVLDVNPKTLVYFGDNMEKVQELADKYNAGQRWVLVSEGR